MRLLRLEQFLEEARAKIVGAENFHLGPEIKKRRQDIFEHIQPAQYM